MTDWRPPTSDEVESMVEDAYRQGLDETFTDEYGTDWDRLIRLYEQEPIDLGTDDDSPTIRRIKAAYRRGLKEQT